MALDSFRLYPFRFRFLSEEPVFLPAGKAGNVIRGALGKLFRRLACEPSCTDSVSCGAREQCLYARFFTPHAGGGGPSGLQDVPRPFVIRAAALDGKRIAAGEFFEFDVHSFDLKESGLAYFVQSFAQLAAEGLGPARGRTKLVRVDQLDGSGRPAVQLFDGIGRWMRKPETPLSIGLGPVGGGGERVRVKFVTPTELKCGNGLAERPEFAVLFSRIRDRVNALRTFYGDGQLDVDFRGLGERAQRVRLVSWKGEQHSVERYSGRTGERHPLGGFTGVAEYEGELGEFLPFLEAARWTGVGRQTVWGKGWIECETLVGAGGSRA